MKLSFGLEDIPMPMVYAMHRIIRDCNQDFLTLFNYSREELIGLSFARLYPNPDDFARIGRVWRANLPGGKAYFDERVMAAGDGRRFWCQVHGRSLDTVNPLSQVIYCFQPIARRVEATGLRLTSRQRQVITLVAQGKTNSEIAHELSLSVRTVESHRARIMRSAGLRNAAELAAKFGVE